MCEIREFRYDDSYPTCVETYSTLRIFSDGQAPGEITKILQIESTDSFSKGDSYSRGRRQRKTNGWFFSTAALCDSKDARRHIDLILASLEGKMDAVNQLRREGSEIDIVTYWVSGGQGGPLLMPCQMTQLGALGISIWWDIYFDGTNRSLGASS